MRVWLLSDTHCQHDKLLIPDGIDMVVHAGDATNSRSPVVNNNEMLKFLEWYEALNIQYKVYVPGNHDTSIEHAYISKDMFLSRGIHLLIDRYLFIRSEDHANMKMWYAEDARYIIIYGSPYTPRFGTGWAYNEDRESMHRHYANLDFGSIDLFVTHGPPHGILDKTRGGGVYRNGINYEEVGISSVGCSALRAAVRETMPTTHVFGHIHNEPGIVNSAVTYKESTQYVNASVVDIYHNLINNGKIIDI